MINQVAIVGGTHGNEFTGIYLLKKWQKQPQLISRSTFTTSTLFANPRAYEHNCRYIDCDLNRRFTAAELADDSLTSYEHSRAKVIDQQLGPKGDPKCDFIIDLHTTTSNMGPCLILPEKGLFYRQLAAYVVERMPQVVVFLDDQDMPSAEHYFLSTIGKKSVLIEVGPVPQSVLRQDVFEQSEQMTTLILDFLDDHNNQDIPPLADSINAFRFVRSIKLPLDDNGERMGMVHSNIQDNDFKPISKGSPLFRTFDGEDILFAEDETLYPAFVNEAAYYDNNLAMSLLRKVDMAITSGEETKL